MSIWIEQLYPAKNATNVGVNEDIHIVAKSTEYLDPRNTKFYINNVEVIPQVFSVYHGDTDHELDIKLYSKRRIKYHTERRYGMPDFRYGQRDIYPSVLQYDQKYVVRVEIWNDNSTLKDSFVFYTEAGVFRNQNRSENFYSQNTQAVANYFPEWSKARYDKYSNTQQLLNPLGEELEKIDDFLEKQRLNSFVQTSNLNELSKLHVVELDKDFEIKSFINQDGESFYVQPEISGLQELTRYELVVDENNDIRTSFYRSMPTRINNERIDFPSNKIFGPELITQNRHEVNSELYREGSISIYVEGLNSSINRYEDRAIRIVKCRVVGQSLFGNTQEEDVLIYDGRFQKTRKAWKRIDYVQFLNMKKEDVTFSLYHFEEPLAITPDLKRYVPTDDREDTVLWKMRKEAGRSILQKCITLGTTGVELLRNAGRVTEIAEFEVLDIDNQTSLDLIDFTSDSYTNKWYGVDSDYLYIFDKREEYPRKLKEIKGDNGSTDYLIELDSDELGLDENGLKEISFKTVHVRPGQTVLRYRMKIIFPSGTIKYIQSDGTLVDNKNDALISGDQSDILLEERQYCFETSEIGDHIIELETVYQGGGRGLHQALVLVHKMSAIIKYKLERILDDRTPISLFIDSDQRLKILDNGNVLHSLVLHKDGVLIDYEEKILYFYEDYSSVDVSE